MPLQLQVVCTDRRTRLPLQEEKRLQVIGEILPFVLAKYGAEAFSRPHVQHESRRFSRRFEVQ